MGTAARRKAAPTIASPAASGSRVCTVRLVASERIRAAIACRSVEPPMP